MQSTAGSTASVQEKKSTDVALNRNLRVRIFATVVNSCVQTEHVGRFSALEMVPAIFGAVSIRVSHVKTNKLQQYNQRWLRTSRMLLLEDGWKIRKQIVKLQYAA